MPGIYKVDSRTSWYMGGIPLRLTNRSKSDSTETGESL